MCIKQYSCFIFTNVCLLCIVIIMILKNIFTVKVFLFHSILGRIIQIKNELILYRRRFKDIYYTIQNSRKRTVTMLKIRLI